MKVRHPPAGHSAYARGLRSSSRAIKVSAADATSFVLMTKAKIRTAFTFDYHFATAGFRIVG